MENPWEDTNMWSLIVMSIMGTVIVSGFLAFFMWAFYGKIFLG